MSWKRRTCKESIGIALINIKIGSKTIKESFKADMYTNNANTSV